MNAHTIKKYALSLVTTIVALLAILLVASKFSIAGMRAFTVQSGSMSPAIFTGSVTFVTPAPSYRVGDIITFRSQGQAEYITHRIVEVQGSGSAVTYRTKGDANQVADSYLVPHIGVVGKVRLDIPLLGFTLNFVKTPLGLTLIILIPSVIIIYEELRKLPRHWREARPALRKYLTVAAAKSGSTIRKSASAEKTKKPHPTK